MIDHAFFILVDDVHINNVLAEHVLRKNAPFSQVVSFTDAVKALDYISGVAKDGDDKRWVIFLDVYMPDVDGWEFLRRFGTMDEQQKRKFRIWMLSSSISPADHSRAKEYAHVSGFISKPLSSIAVKKVLESEY